MNADLPILFSRIQRQKEPRLFKKIYQLSCVQLYGVILRIVRKEHIAEEVMQEAYIKIWHNIDSYDSLKSNPMTWMMRIAKNQAIDTIRKSELDIQDDFIVEILADETHSAFDTINKQEQIQQLNVCLKQIQKQALDVLVLSYFKGLTYEQIASQFNKPTSTIKTWVHRNLPILKKCLEAL